MVGRNKQFAFSWKSFRGTLWILSALTLGFTTPSHARNRMTMGFTCDGLTSGCDNNTDGLPPTKPGKKKKTVFEATKPNSADTNDVDVAAGVTELSKTGLLKMAIDSVGATGRFSRSISYNRNNREAMSFDSFLVFRSFFSDGYYNSLSSADSCKSSPATAKNMVWVGVRGRSSKSTASSGQMFANDAAYKFAGVVRVDSATTAILDGQGAIDLHSLSLDSSAYSYELESGASCNGNTEALTASSTVRPFLGASGQVVWGENTFMAISSGTNPNVAVGLPQTDITASYLSNLYGNEFSGMLFYQSSMTRATYNSLLIKPNSTGTEFSIRSLSQVDDVSSASNWGTLTCANRNQPAQGFCSGTLTKDSQTSNAVCAFATINQQDVMACAAQLPSDKSIPIFMVATIPARATLAFESSVLRGIADTQACGSVSVKNESGRKTSDYSLGTLPEGVSLGANAYDGNDGRCGSTLLAFQTCTVPVCATYGSAEMASSSTVSRTITGWYKENEAETSTSDTAIEFQKVPVPVISGSSDVSSGKGPLNVNFSLYATVGDIVTWVYDFSTSSEIVTTSSLSRTFEVGDYTVSVYGIDSYGQQSNTVTIAISAFIDNDDDGIRQSEDCSDYFYDPTNVCNTNEKNGDNYVWHGGSYFAYFSTAKSWKQAWNSCKETGGHLATITSSEEQNAVWNIVWGSDAWIGLTDRGSEGSFRWVTGETYGYSNFGSGQPDNAGGGEHFVHLSGTWGWNDHLINGWGSGFGYVCEYFDGQTDVEQDWVDPEITSVTYDYAANKLTFNGNLLNELNIYYFQLYNQNTGQWDYVYYSDCNTSDSQWVCNRYMSGGTWNVDFYQHSGNWNYGVTTFVSDAPSPQITSATYDYLTNTLVLNGTGLNDSNIFYYINLYNYNNGNGDYFYFWDCSMSSTQWVCYNRNLSGGTWEISYYSAGWSWNWTGITFTSDRPVPQITSASYDTVNNILTIYGQSLNDSSIFYYFDLYNGSTGSYDYFYFWDCWLPDSSQMQCSRYLQGGTWYIRHNTSWWEWRDPGVSFSSDRPVPQIVSASYDYAANQLTLNGNALNDQSLFYYFDLYHQTSGRVANFYYWDCPVYTDAQLVCNISLGGGTWRIRHYNWNWNWLDSGIEFINDRPLPLITSTVFNSRTKTVSINGQNLEQFLHLNVWNNSNFNSSWYSWDCGAVITATQVTCSLNITSPGRYYFWFYDNFWDQYYGEFDVFEWITGPVLLLKMDGSDGSGSFVDSSPRNQTVNTQGSAVQTTSQVRFGLGSGYFNGASGLRVADNIAFKWGAEKFTIEGWFYPTANSNSSVLWSHRNYASGYGGALLFADSAGELRYVVANADGTGWQTSGDPSTGLNWTLNQWQHIALVRNGDTLTAYLNGVAGTSITVTGEIGSSGDFAIGTGAAQENIGQFFTGYMDEFKVVMAEALYTGNFDVPQLPMNSTTSLLLHMDGAHDSAEFIDSSDYAFAVTTNGGAKQSTSVKKVGTASGVFNGSTDLIIPANAAFNFGPGDFTIEGWMRPSTVTDHMFLMCGGAPGALCFGFNSSGTRFGVLRRHVGWDLNIRVAVQANQWVHVAVSRASGVMKLFLNGVLISTVNNSTSYDLGSGDLYIGSHNGNHYFNGHIDSVRVAKKALYTASFAPPTTPHVTEDNFTGNGVFDEFCYQNFVTLGAVGGGTGWCAGNQTFYIGGIPYPGLNQSGTGTSGSYYFVNAQPANGYLNGKCWDNGLDTQGVASGRGWCTGDSIYYVGGNATPLDKTGRGTYQGQFYINGFLANEVVVTDNTVLLLHFDGADNSEVFTDSARNRTATTRGSPKISTLESKFGGASAYFAGNGFVSYSDDADFAFGTGDFTVELWFKPTRCTWCWPWEMSLLTTADPIDTDGFLMHTTYQRDARFLLGSAEGGWNRDRWYWNWGGAGNWRHYAVSRKNGVTKAFMNGTEVDSFNDNNNYTNINKLIRIGGRTVANQYFEGYIDEVRVTKGKSLYNTNFTVPTSAFSPQVVCYSNGYATTDIDSSGSGTCSSNNERYVNGVKANGLVDGYYYINGFKATELVRDTKTLLLMHGEGSNNSALFEDSSMYLNHITKRGSPVISTAQSKFGSSSLLFPGGENYLRLPNVGGLGSGDFTVEMWVYPQEHGGSVAGGQLIGTTDGSTTGWSFNLGESKDRLRLISNVTGSWRDDLVVSSGGGLDLNQWSHVALVRKGDKLSIFKNGTLVGSTTGFSGKAFPQRTVIIGRFHDGSSVRHFKGHIDEIRLTQGTALYDANFTPSTTPLAVKSICYENGLAVNNVINSQESGYCGVFYYVEGRKMIGLNANGTGYAVGSEICRTFGDYTGDWGTPGGAWGTVSLKLPDTVSLPAFVRITDLGSDDGIGVNGERLTWYSTGTFDRTFSSREYTLSAWNGWGPSGYNAKICYTPSGCFVNGVPTHTINSSGNGTCNGITYVGGAPQ